MDLVDTIQKGTSQCYTTRHVLKGHSKLMTHFQRNCLRQVCLSERQRPGHTSSITDSNICIDRKKRLDIVRNVAPTPYVWVSRNDPDT